MVQYILNLDNVNVSHKVYICGAMFCYFDMSSEEKLSFLLGWRLFFWRLYFPNFSNLPLQ